MSDESIVRDGIGQSAGASADRPVLVWVVSIFYGVGGLFSLLSIMILLGSQSTDSPAGGQLISLRLLLSAILTLGFAIQLFRLRASAVPLCAAELVLSVIDNGYSFDSVRSAN